MTGIICKCSGGLYTVYSEETYFECKARGVFRHKKNSPLIGDKCEFTTDAKLGNPIEKILDRKNELIRPALANLDLLFLAFSVCTPDPDFLYVDKMVSVAIYNRIKPVLIITKEDLNPGLCKTYQEIYEKAGLDVFIVSGKEKSGIDKLKDFIFRNSNKMMSFAGPSGVGKSTLLNTLFPDLDLKTGDLSQKIERGKQTTRDITLFPLAPYFENADGFIADTPGFTMLDFISFNFFELKDLESTFPEFETFRGKCKWRDCTHSKEDNCAVRDAVSKNIISPSRYDSYLAMMEELKQKKTW